MKALFIISALLMSALAFGAQVIPLGQLLQSTTSISNAGTVSTAVNTGGAVLVGIQMPAAFTGTALTFQAATGPSATYQQVVDSSGSAISYTVAAGKYVAVDPTKFHGVQYLKVVSGSAEGGARSLTLMLKGM